MSHCPQCAIYERENADLARERDEAVLNYSSDDVRALIAGYRRQWHLIDDVNDGLRVQLRDALAANASLRDKLAERDTNAARYVALRDAMYDESFDAYDPDALDAELDRRIARQSAEAAEGEK